MEVARPGMDPVWEGAWAPVEEVWLWEEDSAGASAEAGVLVRDFTGIMVNPGH